MGIEPNDPKLSIWNTRTILTLGDIMKKRTVWPPNKEDTQRLRLEVLTEMLNEQEGSLRIGFGLDDPELVPALLEAINSTHYDLKEVLYDDGKRAMQKVEDYKKEYQKHSRWMDYSPDAVLAFTMEHLEKQKDVIKALQDHGVICKAV